MHALDNTRLHAFATGNGALRPVTYSPHVAFGVILTVLGLPGSGGEDALFFSG